VELPRGNIVRALCDHGLRLVRLRAQRDLIAYAGFHVHPSGFDRPASMPISSNCSCWIGRAVPRAAVWWLAVFPGPAEQHRTHDRGAGAAHDKDGRVSVRHRGEGSGTGVVVSDGDDHYSRIDGITGAKGSMCPTPCAPSSSPTVRSTGRARR
jgi:hypothetical protein